MDRMDSNIILEKKIFSSSSSHSGGAGRDRAADGSERDDVSWVQLAALWGGRNSLCSMEPR